MINRTMVRTRVVQTLFAYYKDGEKTPLTAKKDLLNGFASTYNLYCVLLDLVNEITTLAEEQIGIAINKAKATHTPYVANYKFVNNLFAQQVFNNHTLRNYLTNNHLGWDAGLDAIMSIYKDILAAPFYQEYISNENISYEEDKRIWRKIFADILPNNTALQTALEEMELVLDQNYWTQEIDIILSYVVKTIKRFKQSNGEDQPLLQMFESEEEVSFAKDLLRLAIEKHEEYNDLVVSHLKNWDADRIAYMDKIILQTALTEILNFPDIALEVSLNEYLEIAKEYSSEKSHIFINGILDEILRKYKQDNNLLKAMMLRG